MPPAFLLSTFFKSRAVVDSKSSESTSASVESLNSRTPVSVSTDVYDYPTSRAEKEEIVKFLHARLPCVPIKVIRANSLEPEARVFRMRSGSDNQLIGAIVFKDHPDVEFREVKYFCTAYQGGGIGSRLMRALKDDAVKEGLFFIVLYASNTAVQFFAKQLFLNYPDQVIGLSKSVVLGRIEQYQRSTLMASDLVAEYPGSFKYLYDGKQMHIPSVGDSVLVTHGVRRTREEEGIVTDIRDKIRVRVKYPKWTDDTEEWIIVGSKRLRFAEDSTSPDSRSEASEEATAVAASEPTKQNSNNKLMARIKRIRIM